LSPPRAPRRRSPAGPSARSRSSRLAGRLLAALVAIVGPGLACAGCTTAEEKPADARRRPFAPELSGGDPDPGDYWQARFGSYLSRDTPDGQTYRQTPPDERFGAFGLRLLESCLREDQIAPHREEQIRDEDYDTFCDAPTYDDALHFLRWTLGVKPPR
jgi:hypothetical protein